MRKEKIRNFRQLDYIVDPLIAWFDRNKRSLPWRDDPEAYRVWVSEIMLQQTRVEAVKPYFARFLLELPDVASLAGASEERLLKLWEGLGYYNRVRNMQKAAIQVMEEYGGQMPSDYEELLKLKGIGSYTAGAIASIAFGQKVPAVDGNVLRVLSRLTMDAEDISQSSVKKRVEEELLQIMPERAGDFNQALMELGAIVCVPNGAPKCEVCPWKEFCQAHLKKRETEFPCKAAKQKRMIEKKTLLIIKDGHKILLHKRASRGLLAGMYEFPMLDEWAENESIIQYVRQIGCEPVYIEQVREAKHIFSHKEWHMKGYLVKTEPFDFGTKSPASKQADFSALSEEREGKDADQSMLPNGYIMAEYEVVKKEYPVPSAFAAFIPYIEE